MNRATSDLLDYAGQDRAAAVFYLGRVDAHDASKFTIKYHLFDMDTTICGVLGDDDSVTLSIADAENALARIPPYQFPTTMRE